MKQLNMATANENKLAEVRCLLKDNYLVNGLKELKITEEIPENGQTFAENAQIKAQYLYNKTRISSFGDDSGLVVPSLNGEPGIYSARYAGEPQNNIKNINKLINKLSDINDRKAYFIAVICYIDNLGKATFFEGRVEGKITQKPMGNGGFGYDPIFIPDGLEKTFAQMASDEKNKISHRGKAIKLLTNFLNNQKS